VRLADKNAGSAFGVNIQILRNSAKALVVSLNAGFIILLMLIFK